MIRDRLRAGLDRLVSLSRRAAPGPAMVRLGAAMAAIVAVGDAVPTDVLFSGQLRFIAPGMMVAGAGVGLFPRTRWVSAVALFCVGAWLLATFGFGDAASVPRLGILAGSLYAMHAAAAFAAVLPFDCVVAPEALLRWVIRQAAVLAGGLALGLGGMALLAAVQATPSLLGPVVGAVLAAGIAGLLAWQALSDHT